MRKTSKLLRGRNQRAWVVAVACVALAIGAIVLLRGQSRARPQPPEPDPKPSGEGRMRVDLSGPGLSGFAALTQGAVQADGTREVFADVRLEAEDEADSDTRTPVAFGVVLDTSGSMSGDKIAEARRSVSRLVERMRDDDQVALVLYDDSTRVLQPLARVGEVRRQLLSRIDRISAGGGTNIPDALSRGQEAIAEASPRHVRRMVLVSDGRDHSGMSIRAVSRGVSTRADRGVTTSSLGIGTDYNERFLTSVADAGRGNYQFLESGDELERFLAQELEQATGTVADGIVAELELPDGWELARAYGGEAQKTGDTLRLPFGAMYGGQKRHILAELRVDAGAPGIAGSMPVALSYRTVSDDESHALAPDSLVLRSVADAEKAKASRDAELHAEAIATKVDARQAEAMEHWRKGRRDRARRLAEGNAKTLKKAQAASPKVSFDAQIEEYEKDAKTFKDKAPGSTSGRKYRLKQNAERRARMRRAK